MNTNIRPGLGLRGQVSQIEDYFQQMTDQLITLSENTMIVHAMAEFRGAFRQVAADLSVDDQHRLHRDLLAFRRPTDLRVRSGPLRPRRKPGGLADSLKGAVVGKLA